jgi:PTH1 family peptidyl-tRNA hydrolase
VRFGVGRPTAAGDVSNHVLSRFASAERQALDGLLDQAVAAVEAILARGVAAAMNEFNGRDLVA